MNVGQILEPTSAGAAGLGRRSATCWSAPREPRWRQIKKQLREIYGEKSFRNDIADLDDEQTIELAATSAGRALASPVFDGAHEADIVEMLEMAGLDRSGQVTLVDGRTASRSIAR